MLGYKTEHGIIESFAENQLDSYFRPDCLSEEQAQHQLSAGITANEVLEIVDNRISQKDAELVARIVNDLNDTLTTTEMKNMEKQAVKDQGNELVAKDKMSSKQSDIQTSKQDAQSLLDSSHKVIEQGEKIVDEGTQTHAAPDQTQKSTMEKQTYDASVQEKISSNTQTLIKQPTTDSQAAWPWHTTSIVVLGLALAIFWIIKTHKKEAAPSLDKTEERVTPKKGGVQPPPHPPHPPRQAKPIPVHSIPLLTSDEQQVDFFRTRYPENIIDGKIYFVKEMCGSLDYYGYWKEDKQSLLCQASGGRLVLINPQIGDPFDQDTMRRPVPYTEPTFICEVLSQGQKMDGKVIREAFVKDGEKK